MSDQFPDFIETDDGETLEVVSETKTAAQTEAQTALQVKMYLPEAVQAELARLPVSDRTRPTDYTPELSQAILLLRAYGWAVTRIEALSNMPNRVTIWEWRRKYPEFGTAYDQLYQDFLDASAEESIAIADSPLTGGGNVKRDKLRVETRLQVAGRRMPNRWGEKATGNSTTVIIQAAIFEKKSNLQTETKR